MVRRDQQTVSGDLTNFGFFDNSLHAQPSGGSSAAYSHTEARSSEGSECRQGPGDGHASPPEGHITDCLEPDACHTRHTDRLVAPMPFESLLLENVPPLPSPDWFWIKSDPDFRVLYMGEMESTGIMISDPDGYYSLIAGDTQIMTTPVLREALFAAHNIALVFRDSLPATGPAFPPFEEEVPDEPKESFCTQCGAWLGPQEGE